MLLVFIVLVIYAARIFSTDKDLRAKDSQVLEEAPVDPAFFPKPKTD